MPPYSLKPSFFSAVMTIWDHPALVRGTAVAGVIVIVIIFSNAMTIACHYVIFVILQSHFYCAVVSVLYCFNPNKYSPQSLAAVVVRPCIPKP